MSVLPPMLGGVNTATVEIAAHLDAVWQILFDRARWIDGFIGKVAVDGPVDAIGERAKFTTQAPDGTIATRMEEILVSDPPHRLVTRLALEENDATFAFAEWRLAREAAVTSLEMNLYWTDLPEDGANWPAIQNQRQGYLDHTQATLETLVAKIAEAATASPATR